MSTPINWVKRLNLHSYAISVCMYCGCMAHPEVVQIYPLFIAPIDSKPSSKLV